MLLPGHLNRHALGMLNVILLTPPSFPAPCPLLVKGRDNQLFQHVRHTVGLIFRGTFNNL